MAYFYEKSKNFTQAQEMYTEALTTAKSVGDEKSEGAACEKLGLLLISMKKAHAAVPYFERNYQLALKNATDKKWVSQATIQLGYAKGEALLLQSMATGNVQDLMFSAMNKGASNTSTFSSETADVSTEESVTQQLAQDDEAEAAEEYQEESM